MNTYDHKAIDTKWQAYWDAHNTFKTAFPSDKPKYYILDMFPYPSGAGLHVGHPMGYIGTDTIARKKRMDGYNVLHPMGFDAFGLPTENYAIKTGISPQQATKENIERYIQQLKMIGLSYDWSRCLSTTDESYYKWTQWLFLEMYKKGLLYENETNMAWCDACKTVCANEEVVKIDGKNAHERCQKEITYRATKQWMFRITAYAERLLNDLDELIEWPESIKTMQRQWIGKSTGATILFPIDGLDDTIKAFTTRIDTLFGATYIALAPEHKLAKTLITYDRMDDYNAYMKHIMSMTDIDRMDDTRHKNGFFTGTYALHPITHNKLPIYLADYVLEHYGTGAIMCVPAHDERDYAFAIQYNIPITYIYNDIEDTTKAYIQKDKKLTNSMFLDDLDYDTAVSTMLDYIVKNGIGYATVSYKLRDWIFTRQRYWGEPIPLIHAPDGAIIPLSDDELPLILPPIDDYKPSSDGASPLAKLTTWTHTERGIRETSTMPNWAGSCWYYLRFMSPHDDKRFVDQYFGQVDMYVGGAEHAVLHLLYARFWHKVLYDLGYVSHKEPFKALKNQGLIIAEDGRKMSKSFGNVVNPDDICKQYGTDAFRIYEMFMGPFEQSKRWDTKTLIGSKRFLERVYRLVMTHINTPHNTHSTNKNTLSLLHKTILQVSTDIDSFSFNTAIAALMSCTNELYKLPTEALTDDIIEPLILMLSPFAPHLMEELWSLKGYNTSISTHPFPQYNKDLVIQDTVLYTVQIANKSRGTIEMPIDSTQNDVLDAIKMDAHMNKFITTDIKKVIFKENTMISIVL